MEFKSFGIVLGMIHEQVWGWETLMHGLCCEAVKNGTFFLVIITLLRVEKKWKWKKKKKYKRKKSEEGAQKCSQVEKTSRRLWQKSEGRVLFLGLRNVLRI